MKSNVGKRSEFILCALLLLCFPWSIRAVGGERGFDISKAKNTLLRLFDANDVAHGKSLDWGNTKVTGQYFDSVLVRLFQLNHACEVATKEICSLNSDPVFFAQDYDDRGIKTEIIGVSVDSIITFSVKIINIGEQVLKYEMSKEGLNWKISDIQYPESASLKSILKVD